MMHWNVVGELVQNPVRGAEVGVRTGNCTVFLLRKFPKLTLYAVDLWDVRPPMDRPGYQTYEDWDFKSIKGTFMARAAEFGERCIPMQMDSVAAAGLIEDATLDFVFIDAEHTYEGVKGDITAWKPKVKKGGVLCGHDYGHSRFPGVKKAVNEMLGDVRVDERSTVWSVRV